MTSDKRGNGQLNEQLTKSGVKNTNEVPNLRIFVEQAIRHVKTFRLIKYELPISLLDNIDDKVIVCAAICNLNKPLCKKWSHAYWLAKKENWLKS